MARVAQPVEVVADPREVGIVPERLEALLQRARREVDEGLLPSCQLAIAREGELAAFTAYGDATTDTQYVIFSSTKAIVASAMWLLIGEGRVSPEQRVVELIPEFGTNGKDVVTVEQVMLHTAGFPMAPFVPVEWDDRERRLARFGRWRLEWEPGTRYQYHATSAHWVLAEIIERVSGSDFRELVRARVAEPVGLPGIHVGYPVDEQRDVADVVHTGDPMTADELEQAFGVREVPVGEVTEDALLSFNLPDVRAVGVPGGGGIMRAAELALFYQALLRNPIWSDDVLRDATGRVRNNLPDPIFRTPASRGLGVVIAGDDGLGHMRGFGRTSSPRTFGHGGAGGQIGWADPDTGISFAYLTNGMDRHQLRQGRRGVALSSLAGVCAAEPD